MGFTDLYAVDLSGDQNWSYDTLLWSYSLLTKKLGRDVYLEWGRNEKLAKKKGAEYVQWTRD